MARCTTAELNDVVCVSVAVGGFSVLGVLRIVFVCQTQLKQ